MYQHFVFYSSDVLIVEQAVRSSDQMTQSMKDATRLLGSMNRSMNLPQLQKIAMDFEKENDIMDQRQEMMDDAIDDAIGDEYEDDEEADEIVNKVLDEIGVDLNSQMKDTPQGLDTGVAERERVPQAVGANGEGDGEDDDLQARLNSLKKRWLGSTSLILCIKFCYCVFFGSRNI